MNDNTSIIVIKTRIIEVKFIIDGSEFGEMFCSISVSVLFTCNMICVQ